MTQFYKGDIMKKSLILMTALIIASCAEEAAGPTLEDAWQQFENKDYQSALESFQAFIPDTVEAYVGAGWSSLRLYQYAASVEYFSNAVENTHAQAGWCFALWATGDLNGAIAKADYVFQHSTAYAFAHDPRVNYQDIHLVKASANFELGRYHQSLLSIRQIDPSFVQAIASGDSASVLLAKLTQFGPVN